MAATIKDLGKVTAYAYAKAAGYPGTEEEFQQVFDEFTQNAPGLITRMDTAVARAEAAVTEIDATVQDAVDDAVEEATASAVATANQAVTDAQAAQTAAEGAVTQANAAVTQANAAVTAAQAAQAAAEDAAESFVIDDTLSVSGAAADAKKTGHEVSFVKKGIPFITGNEQIEFSDPSLKQYIITNGTSVQWDTPSVSASTHIKWSVTECSNGDVFTIYGRGGNSDRLWAFADSSKNIISASVVGASANGLQLVAPQSAAYLIINSETDMPSFKGALLVSEVNNIARSALTAFCTGCNINCGTTSCTISWTRLFVKKVSEAIDLTDAQTFTLTNSSPLLILRNNTAQLASSYNSLLKDDIVLLSFRDGIITGGILTQYSTTGYVTKSNMVQTCFTVGLIASESNASLTVSFNRLYVRYLDGSTFDSSDTYSFTLSNSLPLLFLRNKTNIATAYSYGQLSENDVVLLAFRDRTIHSGILYPAVKKALEESISEYVFEDDSSLNVHRQARQLAELKWTPKKDVIDGYVVTNAAGVEVTGVPYSSVKEYLKYVGIDVSLHTFMTAVNDEHSLMYTECPIANPTYQRSEYERVYYGVNSYCYFGSVCSGFVTTALGSVIQYNSWEFRTFPEKFKVLKNQSVLNLKVGDVLSEPGHAAVLTKIDRNSDGSIKYFELDEHSAPIRQGIHHTEYSLTNRTRENGGKWCRPLFLDENTNYKPSTFVLLDNEYLYKPGNFVFVDDTSSRTFWMCTTSNSDATFTPSHWTRINSFVPNIAAPDYVQVGEKMYYCTSNHTTASTFEADSQYWIQMKGITEWVSYPYIYNNDIVTFAGDQAAFHSNDLIYIDFNENTSYTQMQIYKDGSLIQTLPLPSNSYHIDVSSYCATAGMYKARLTDGTNYSRYTYFEVIDTTVSATMNNGSATISFSSTNGIPVEAQIVEQSGGTICHIAFNDTELKNGQIVIDPQARLYIERKDLWDYYSTLEGSTRKVYARVMFKGEFGNVVNQMIELGDITATSGEVVFPNEPTYLGEITSNKKIMLSDRTEGNDYSFSFVAGNGAAITIQPASGTIKWRNAVPTNLTVGTTYLITINNGIGDAVSAV